MMPQTLKLLFQHFLKKSVFILLLFGLKSFGQETFKIGFYNVENFFDAQDDPKTFDEEYTPKGRHRWKPQHVAQKTQQLATVIHALAERRTDGFPVLLGLAEVENFAVLRQLVRHPLLRVAGYEIIHFDSPDRRGIDVALLYQPAFFAPINIKKAPLLLKNPKTQNRLYTRDMLLVTGMLFDQEVTVSVNHWPSRRGGKSKSAPLRQKAAQQQLRLMDSLYRLDHNAKIIVMGDFNDDPNDLSLKRLQQKDDFYTAFKPLYNPFLEKHKKGYGSLAYKDRWFLFDQILFSPAWTKEVKFLEYKAASIFHPKWLHTPAGRYKGYPFRTQKKGGFLTGYSDHFPVTITIRVK